MTGKVTVIARWETGQMSPLKEWKMWRQVKGSFNVDRFVFVPTQKFMTGYTFDQYDTMEEALASADGKRVFLEPTGYNSVYDIPQGDIVLVLGNTDSDNLMHAQVNETYAIKTPAGPTMAHLYGTNAASIALAIRYGQ